MALFKMASSSYPLDKLCNPKQFLELLHKNVSKIMAINRRDYSRKERDETKPEENIDEAELIEEEKEAKEPKWTIKKLFALGYWYSKQYSYK